MLHCNNHYVRVFGFRIGRMAAESLKPVLKECYTELGGDSEDEDDTHDKVKTPNADAWGALQALNPHVASLIRAVSGAPADTTAPSHVLRREILTARRGQRAKHWVNWEQVACDVRHHKIHCLLLVKPTGQRGLTQAPPFIDQSDA